MKLETADMACLGTCKKMTISKDDTVILDGAGGAAAVEERCEVTLGLGWLGLGVGVGVGGRAAVEERCEVLRDAIVDT